MGILTSNPYENAWIIVGLGAAAIVVASIIGGGLYFSLKSKVPSIEELFCTSAILMSALIPLGLFSSGIFIDFINQSYQYSTGSIVGLIGAMFTGLFGSSAFADFSKNIVGFLPSVKDAAGNISYLGVGVLVLILGSLAGGSGAAFGLGGTLIGEGVTLGVVMPLVLILLAGYGLLGKFSSSAPAVVTGGSTFQINPYPSGFCDVPGFTWASNGMAPVSIVLTQSILWYYMIQGWDTGNASHTPIVGAGSLLTFALQWLALAKNDCLQSYQSGLYAPLLSLVISIATAGISYEVIKNLPASTGGTSSAPGVSMGGITMAPIPPTPGKGCPPNYTLEADGMCHVRSLFEQKINVGGQQDTSAPVDDQDAFVCEAYKDGELVTSTIVE